MTLDPINLRRFRLLGLAECDAAADDAAERGDPSRAVTAGRDYRGSV